MSFASMPIGDMGGPQMYGGPAGQPISGGGGIAGQTQDQIDNPIYGGNSPFQPPPMTTQPMDSFGGSGGGKLMGGGMIPGIMGQASQQLMGSLFGGGGQMYGGPAGQPILSGTPMQGNNPLAGFGASNSVMAMPQNQQNLNRAMPQQQPRAPIPQSTYGRTSSAPQQPLYRGGLRQPPNNYRPPARTMR